MKLTFIEMFEKNIWMHTLFCTLGSKLREAEKFGVHVFEFEDIFLYKIFDRVQNRAIAQGFYGEANILYAEKRAREAYLLAYTIMSVYNVEDDDLPFAYNGAGEDLWFRILEFAKETYDFSASTDGDQKSSSSLD